MSIQNIFSDLKFPLGMIVITPGARDSLTPRDVVSSIRRHASGDWGNLDDYDLTENEESLAEGRRLFSRYDSQDTKFWIITEADRSSTCILLPEEY